MCSALFLLTFFSCTLFLTLHPPIPLCLGLLLWAAKSVMVTALLSCPSVSVGAASGHLTPTPWRRESWGAPLSSTPGQLTSPLGPDGVTTLSPPLHFSDECTALMPLTRAALSCATLNDFLLSEPRPANLRCFKLSLHNASLSVSSYLIICKGSNKAINILLKITAAENSIFLIKKNIKKICQRKCVTLCLVKDLETSLF